VTAPQTGSAFMESMAKVSLTYPTLSAFMESMARVSADDDRTVLDENGSPDYLYLDTVGVVEQMLLLLLTRWQLEDEGDKDNQLPEVHADITALNKDATDAERGLVMAHLVAWAQSDDGWLADYILRIGKLS